MNRMNIPPEVGPTRDFPQGKLNDHDEGGLNVAIGIDSGQVVLAFGSPVAWFGMDYEQAERLGISLLAKSAECRNRQLLSEETGKDFLNVPPQPVILPQSPEAHP